MLDRGRRRNWLLRVAVSDNGDGFDLDILDATSRPSAFCCHSLVDALARSFNAKIARENPW